MANYIILGFNIFGGVFLGLGILFGFLRGIKKTSSRLLFLMLTTVILLFVTAPITSLLLKIPVATTIVEDGISTNTTMSIAELISYFVEQLLGNEFVTKYPDFADLIVVIPLLLINSIVYIVLFWLLKYILLPLNFLITKFLLRSHRRRPAVAFANMGNDPEYRNSDTMIDPLLEVYKNSENTPADAPTNTTKANEGSFIPTDSNLDTSSPNGQKLRSIQVTKPESKASIQKKEKKERQKELKEDKKLLKSEKPKKYRLLGALIGSFVGILIIINTLIPVYGVMNILRTHNKTTLNHLTGESISLDIMTDGLTGEIVKGYELSAIGRISDFLGLSDLGVKGFDLLTTDTVGEHRIVLREDINSTITAVLDIDNLIGMYKTATKDGLENISQDDLTALINGTDKIITSCKQTEFITAISDYILPITYEILRENDIQLSESPVVNDLILLTIKKVAEDHSVEIFEELRSFVDLTRYLNDQKILIHIVRNDYDNFLTTIHNLDEDFSDTLTNKIFAVKSIDTTLPNILDIGLTVFDNATNFGYVANTATEAEIKSSFTRLLNNVVSTAITVSDESPIYLTDESLPALGKTMDTLKSSKLLHTETYENLQDYLIARIKESTTTIVPNRFKDTFNNQLLRNICHIESWENEMKVITDTLNILRNKDHGILGNIQEGSELRVGYDAHFTLSEPVLINIGKALDTLEQSTLLGTAYINTPTSTTNTTLTKMFALALEELYEQSSIDADADTKDILSIANTMSANLMSHGHTTTEKNFWANEMKAISPLIMEINTIASSKNMSIRNSLGVALDDCAQNSVLLGGNTTLKLMSKLMGVIEESILGDNFEPAGDDSINDNIYHIISGMKTNLDNFSTTIPEDFWQNEITCIRSLTNIADEAANISTISAAKDIASDLDTVYSSRIIPIQQFNNTIANVLRQLKTSDTTGVTGQINDLIEDIATDISDTTFWDNTVTDRTDFWQIELGHISRLDSMKLDDNITDTLDTIGLPIDQIVGFDTTDTSITRPSYLITSGRINTIIASSLRETADPSATTGSVTAEINGLIEDIADDISSTTFWLDTVGNNTDKFWQIELGHINRLNNIELDGNNVKDQLSTIGSTLDKITGYDKQDTTIARQSYLVTEPRIRKILSTSINNISSSFNAGSHTTINTAIVTAVQDISNNIYNTSIADSEQIAISSFATELGYLNTLSTLEVDSSLFNQFPTPIEPDGTNQEAVDARNNQITEFENKIKSTLADLGGKLDSIAYNTTTSNNTTSFDDTNNSKWITRPIISNIMQSVFESAKLTGDDSSNLDDAFNAMVERIKTSINTITTDNRVITWTRELSYVTYLLKLNSDVKINLNNITTHVTANIDKIAFNEKMIVKNESIKNGGKYADIIYEGNLIKGAYATTYKIRETSGSEYQEFFYNSVIITRSDLSAMVNTLLDDVKPTPSNSSDPTDTNLIASEMVDNLKNNINTTQSYTGETELATDKFNDYTTAFEDLNDLKDSIDTISTTYKFDSINDIDETIAKQIDTNLQDYQDNILCGPITTRRIALTIANIVHDTILAHEGFQLLREANQTLACDTYITNLISHYTTYIAYASSTNEDEKNLAKTLENYSSDTTGEYNNPFYNLYRQIQEDLNRIPNV